MKPKKAENGYREYSKNDVALLNEISLYRNLDISIKDIKGIISSESKKNMLYKVLEEKQKKEIQLKMQQKYLEIIIESDFNESSVKAVKNEIVKVEKMTGEYIRRELMRAFPSGLGIYIKYHFSSYLNEPLDTVEKQNAWTKIVNFLDSVPEIKIPKIIKIGYENASDEMFKRVNENALNEINKLFSATNEELEVYKKKLLDGIEKEQDESLFKRMSPYYKYKKQLNEFFNSSGYYDVFIPNMKIISKDYKEYHDNLLTLNKKLSKEIGIMYDDNMRIIASKSNNLK